MFDFLKGNFYKKRMQELELQLSELKNSLTPEMHDAIKLKEQISFLENKVAELTSTSNNYQSEISELKDNISKLNDEIDVKSKTLTNLNYGLTVSETLSNLNQQLKEKEKQLIQTDEQILLQEFALYEPKYDFENSAEYKSRLQKVRQDQKDMIKAGTAATGNMNWTVNGSNAQGKKMVKDMQKLLLRAFNSECDEVIDKVKYNNFETALKRISSSYEAISKLGKIMSVSINQRYYNSKIDELTIAFEYRTKVQEEKELQKELRAQMREEAKIQKEIERERQKIEKEQTHYQNALTQIKQQLETATDSNRAELENKLHEIENHLTDIDKAIKDIDYREANQRAGYVYIISNIGSFGENVYKIGMTRRLDPMERVHELGDASVPFNFDVHAMIFSDDAPKLETALHKAFENKKLNMVNQRREFFNVTLDEIKEVVKNNFDKTVEFIDIAEAEQYRISQKMKQ